MDQRPSVYRRYYTGLSSWAQWEMLCRNYIDYVDRSDFDVDSTWFCPPNRRIIDFDVDSMIHFSLGRGVVGPERRVASTSVGRKVGCHSDVALASHPHPPRIYNVAPRSNIARNPPHIWDPDGPQRTAKLKMRINQKKNLGCMKFAKDALDCQRVFLGLR